MNFLGGVLGVAVTFLLAWLLGRPNDRAFRGAAGVMAVGFGLIAGGFLLFALWPKAQENLDLPNKAVLQITGLAVLVVGTLTLPHLLLLPRRERWWHSVGRTLILLLCLFLFALMVLALGAGGVIDTDQYARTAAYALLPAQGVSAYLEWRRSKSGDGFS
ncbi:hypothetical protein HLB42_11765 [Deinococcus sp. D7000]|nr:hypothetical protein HLB42_11765 [Deinococcus sp. D7000]